MMVIAANGIWPKKSTGGKPKPVAMRPKMPLTGFMNMFFHTSAETVGITKKGAITMMRMMPFPNIGRSRSKANRMPPITVITRTPPTSTSVLIMAAVKLGSVRNQ